MPAKQTSRSSGPSITRLRDQLAHHIQKVFLGLAVVLALGMVGLFSGGGSSAPRDAQAAQGQNVVAGAAGTDIREAQVDQLAERYSQGGTTVDPREKLRNRSYALQTLTDEALKVDAAHKAGFSVSNADVKAEEDRLFKEASQQQLAGLSEEDKRKYESRLRDQIDENRDQIQDELLVKKWGDSLKSKINPNDPKTPNSDIELRARHILIRVKDPKAPPPPKGAKPQDQGLPDAQAKQKAEQVLAEVKKPHADFAALAKKYSQDPGSAQNGGDLNWFHQGQMVPEFDKAAYALKPGQVSGLVKTQFGYHILKLEDRRVADSAKDRLINDYLEKARKTANIAYHDEALAGVRAMTDAAAPGLKPKEKAAKYQEALADLEKARQQDPSNAGVWGLIGDLYKQQYDDGGRKDAAVRSKAIEAYEAAAKITPAPRLRVDLARLYEDEGKKPAAIEQLKKAADVAYTDPTVRSDLESSFKRLGQERLAADQKKLIDEANKHQPGGGMTFPIHVPGH